jgi:hypothetical protein
MPDPPAKLAEHHRKLAAEEVAMAKLAFHQSATLHAEPRVAIARTVNE